MEHRSTLGVSRSTLGILALAALPAAGCRVHRDLAHPTVVIQTEDGIEQGASTDYGVVFLGRTAQSGDVDITAWYGDGPSIEASVIEPVGGGLYTAETEIRLPSVPLTFQDPAPGDELLVSARIGDKLWERHVRVVSAPGVDGILLPVPDEMRGRPELVGAGVYVCLDDKCLERKLLGLVSGVLRLVADGATREYLAVVGPRDLWRLVTYERELKRKKTWVYRDDVL